MCYKMNQLTKQRNIIMNHKLITIILFLCLCTFAEAQESITGSVKSITFGEKFNQSVDNLPLPGVNIVLKGTNFGTTTDFDGNFSILAPSNGTLVISFIGYKTQNITINNRNEIDVILEEDFEFYIQ